MPRFAIACVKDGRVIRAQGYGTRNAKLTMQSPGGAPAELIPALAGEFTHQRFRDLRIKFALDGNGKATSIILMDSTGLFEGKRAE